jgi:hypothetical protein
VYLPVILWTVPPARMLSSVYPPVAMVNGKLPLALVSQPLQSDTDVDGP